MANSRDEGYDILSVLDQMREEYWEALSQEEGAEEELLDCLILVLGGERYAFETRHALEVVRVPKLILVPGVQGPIAGIFNLRGDITAAMDIRPMLGLPQPELGSSGRVVVVRAESFATGILAESAPGVRGLSFERFHPAAGQGGGEVRFVRGHFEEEEGPVILLDLKGLLASPEILAGEP